MHNVSFFNDELLTVVYPRSLRDVPVPAYGSLTYCGGAFGWNGGISVALKAGEMAILDQIVLAGYVSRNYGYRSCEAIESPKPQSRGILASGDVRTDAGQALRVLSPGREEALGPLFARRSWLRVVRPSPVPGAVFVSYASQDAEAAQRLCGTLRSAGVEVWFDQSELVGGDAWDAKIRAQIRACALFVPVISAATQSRREGYFRIEWKLAAQRSHAFADGAPFLLPVVIDATRDPEALVPEEFRAVQWTRLPAGDAGPAFCARMRQLLAAEMDVGVAEKVAGRNSGSYATFQSASRSWLPLAALALMVLAAAAIWRPWHGNVQQPSSAATPAVAAQDSSPEIAQIRAHLVPERFQSADFDAVSPMLDRLIEANPESSDALALRSIINSLSVIRTFDSGTKPLEVGREAAERALRLAPDSPLAGLALGLHLVAMTSRGGDAAAAWPYIQRALPSLPRDPLTRYAELLSYWEGFQFKDTERCAKTWQEEQPGDGFPAWILAQMYLATRQPDQAEKWAERAALDPNINTSMRALVTLFEVEYYLRADLPSARTALDRIKTSGVQTDRVVYMRWLLDMAEHRWDQAIQELAQIPETTLFDRNFQGPKAFLAGLAVESQQVVPAKWESGDGGLVLQGGVGTMPVVTVEPRQEMGMAFV